MLNLPPKVSLLGVMAAWFVFVEIVNGSAGVIVSNAHLINKTLFHSLSVTHKDPFNRIIIWQAIQRKMTLISKDRDFKAYHKFGLRTFW